MAYLPLLLLKNSLERSLLCERADYSLGEGVAGTTTTGPVGLSVTSSSSGKCLSCACRSEIWRLISACFCASAALLLDNDSMKENGCKVTLLQ